MRYVNSINAFRKSVKSGRRANKKKEDRERIRGVGMHRVESESAAGHEGEGHDWRFAILTVRNALRQRHGQPQIRASF
jgi:hypothetical protein